MNKYVPHVFVVPEDDRNRQIADGFILHHELKANHIQVMPLARGWRNALEMLQDEYIPTLRRYSLAHVVMLIDFDDRITERRAEFEAAIPNDLIGRVFVVGSKNDPETLKRAMNIDFESIGRSLADDCRAGTFQHWDHEQLQHNDGELQRLVQTVRPFLF